MTDRHSTPLHQLSAWATQGIWRTGFAHWGRIQICGPDRTIGELNAYVGLGGAENALNAEQENNGAFICALVNAYRSGALVARSESTSISAGGAYELKLYGTPGYVGTIAGITVHSDPNVPEHTVVIKDELGRELGRIINVGL